MQFKIVTKQTPWLGEWYGKIGDEGRGFLGIAIREQVIPRFHPTEEAARTTAGEVYESFERRFLKKEAEMVQAHNDANDGDGKEKREYVPRPLGCSDLFQVVAVSDEDAFAEEQRALDGASPLVSAS